MLEKGIKVNGSSIFSIENLDNDINYLHVNGLLSSVDCHLRNIQKEHLVFYSNWFSDPKAMKLYGTGTVYSNAALQCDSNDSITPAQKEAEKKYQMWNSRFEKSQPHGGLTIISNESSKPIGFIVAGGGDEPGASEVAYILDPDYWRKGIGASALNFIVKAWAPEVKAIGNAVIIDDAFPYLKDSFSCFGNEPLARLQATCSPINIASEKMLRKSGFTHALPGLSDSMVPVFDLTTTSLSLANPEDYIEVKERFLTDGLRRPNIRYQCIDQEGIERTLSFKDRFDALRFHMEYAVSDISL
ncbi:MAG: hypothetical protein K0R73_280 [Candidatus Midichloriaceae bacterium]|jgi:RimJ/RimL family protein N-acetyltransferase|nr:hypothetical protein [Candidatus Midichloriaceae bacterium]